MDINSLLGTVLSDASIQGVSQTSAVSGDQTRSILNAAMPALLGGALNQAKGADTSAGFATALSQHAAGNTADLTAFLGSVDTQDGAKIVNHLLGSDSAAVVDQIAKDSGVQAADVKKVLASAAPLVMSLLGKETQKRQDADSAVSPAGVLGSLMGGGSSGGLLGSLLGGKSGGLGSILGSFLK